MTRMKKHTSLPVIVLLAALCVVLAYQAGANRPAGVGRTPVIATVNLNAVLEGLEQRGHAEEALRTMHREIMGEAEQREGRIRSMQSELEQSRQQNAEQPPTPAQEKLEEDLVLDSLNYRRWQQVMAEKLDIERAIQLQDMYRAIRQAASEMAEAEGFDLVIVDDSGGELMFNPEARATREAQVQQQILARNVLFAGTTLDITSDLVARMNNRFRAGNQ
jgi:Skp family chaperone for outer membrane proteins